MSTPSDWDQDDEFIVDAFEDAIDRAKKKGWTQEDLLTTVWELCTKAKMDHDQIILLSLDDPLVKQHEGHSIGICDSCGEFTHVDQELCQKCGRPTRLDK